MLAALETRANRTHIIEDRVIVTDGSRKCPSRDGCEPRTGESFQAYVFRHCKDHEIFEEFREFADYERNLYLWCFYGFHKFCLDNRLLTPQPFWEDHEFLANWEFDEEDLEMNVPHEKRLYALPEAADRKPGEYRSGKKIEKPRETLKTTEGFAFVTWEHLRARFVDDNTMFRVTAISSTRKLVKKRYILAAEKVWGARSGKLFDLFGGWEEYGPEGKKQRRRISLIRSRGAIDRVECTVILRWLHETTSSYATHSLIGFGAEVESTGERSDLTVADDLCTAKNSDKFEKRQKIKDTLAEQEKQLEHGGRIVWFNTRKHLDDASGEIDKEPMRQYWHILHRKAFWYGADGNVHYYWPVDGLGKPRIDEAYLEEQRDKHGERDFWNELMNEPQDPEKALFKREWFLIVKNKDAPLEVTAGLGLGIEATAEEMSALELAGVRIRPYGGVDPAGRERAIKRNDDTGLIGLRFDRASNIYITHLASGKWPDSGIKEQVWALQQVNKNQVIFYEAMQDSGVEAGFQRYQENKSKELDAPVLLPVRIVKPSTVISKQQKIEGTEPHARRGAIRILESAGSKEEIQKFIRQHTGYLIEDHDEYPDILATIIKEVGVVRPASSKPAKVATSARIDDGTLSLPIGNLIKKMTKPGASSWGRAGGRG